MDAYEGWPDLPENAYFIDIYVGPRKGVEYLGMSKSPERKILINFPDAHGKNETLFVCYQVNNIFGFGIGKKDKKFLKNTAKKLLSSEIGVGNANERYIEVLQAREILFGKG